MGFFDKILGLFSSKPDYSKIRTRKVKEQEAKEKTEKPKWVKWVKFGVVSFLWLLFIIWVRSWLGIIVFPLIYDIYISKKINWHWWKREDRPFANSIMSWVDAIVFALVAVYFVNNFFFQNYKIPSSSLEKTLMTGDYLLVSKLSYGPRIPMTPLTMPLTQHTLPIFNCKSYIEWPQWDYKRAAGLGDVEWGDIVVFNYPTGDTVATFYNNDFYLLCYRLGEDHLMQTNSKMLELTDSSTVGQMNHFYKIYAKGKEQVAKQKVRYGDITTRPVDRRENYVKRCVGLPGQKFEIRNKVIYINGVAQNYPDSVQFNYYLYMKPGKKLTPELCEKYNISDEDRKHFNDRPSEGLFETEFNQGMPMTFNTKEKLEKLTNLVDSIVPVPDNESGLGSVYPLDHDYGWTRDNYGVIPGEGPITIPAKGMTIKLTMDNIAVYERPIRTYEGNMLEVKSGGIYINGKKADKYTFKMDYYWMMGDNRHNSLDSRYWGFVPEDHVVGKPLFIWLSSSPDPWEGIRWRRLFTGVHGMKFNQ